MVVESLAGQHVLVTGGAQGIGRAIAEGALRRGAQVTIFDVDGPMLADAQSDLTEKTNRGAALQGLRVDV
ncbi:MAG: SDR family NAD(P)-dependent oxidoreductase, partial [Actinomycetales bacterium]